MFPCVALVCLATLPGAARPAEGAKPAAPGFVVRVQSLDELIADVKYVAKLIGREDQAEQVEGLLKAKAGPKGLDGIDVKRPMGVYGRFGNGLEDITAVALIPVADEKAFLGLLENLNVKAEKGEDGLYKAQAEGGLNEPVYFRFAHKYAYVTVKNQDAVAKDKLLPPGTVLAGPQKDALSLAVHIDQIPAGFRDIAVSQLQMKLDDAKEQKEPNETEAQHKLKVEMVEEISRRLTSVLKEGGAVAVRLNIDRQAGELSLDLALGGQPGSGLAAGISHLGEMKSAVAGLIRPDSAASAQVNLPVPEKLRKDLQPVLEEALSQAVAQEKDKAKREHLQRVIKAVQPALKVSDAFDVALDVRAAGDGRFTLVAGQQVKDGAAAEKALRDVVQELPADQRQLIKLDAEKAGGVAIHRIELKDVDEDFKKTFGSGPAYAAVRADAGFFAVGENALDALKAALQVQPTVGKPMQLEVSLARFAPSMAKEQPAAPKAAEEAFKEKGSDKMWIAIEAGKELRLRFAMKAQVLKFLHLLEPGAGAEK
jgi:hypothetical protein